MDVEKASKAPLLGARDQTPSSTPRLDVRRQQIFRVLVLLVVTGAFFQTILGGPPKIRRQAKSLCPQASALAPPPEKALDDALDRLNTPQGRNESNILLSRAVQHDTATFDDSGPVDGPDADPRWERFVAWRAFLSESFPKVHELAKLDLINKHGLLYTVQGRDPSLKPVVLMAHQDVVPIEPSTRSSWTYPPYSGAIAEGWIWGRGVCDCKTLLMSLMRSLDSLLGAGFQPKRTIVLSFGFDEETDGINGAGALAPELIRRYGKDGVEMIMDEAGRLRIFEGKPFAMVATSERGRTNLNITVNGAGGHSSVPPDHSSIGLLSDLIVRLEAHPFAPGFKFDKAAASRRSPPSADNPYFDGLQCRVAHAPSSLPKSISKAIVDAPRSPAALKRVISWAADRQGGGSRYSISTSQSVTLSRGGYKFNVVPRTAWAFVNYRVSMSSSRAALKDHVLKKTLVPFAKYFNLSLNAYDGHDVFKGTEGSVVVTESTKLDPAPISPSSLDDKPWRVLAGTLRHVYGDEMTVAPTLALGNTDTHYYWDLTRYIYRLVAMDDAKCPGQHDVNERIEINEFPRVVAFYHTLIRNLGAM